MPPQPPDFSLMPATGPLPAVPGAYPAAGGCQVTAGPGPQVGAGPAAGPGEAAPREGSGALGFTAQPGFGSS